MRVLIVGGAGMLGHKIWQTFRDRFDTYVTLRDGVDRYAAYNLFDPARVITVDVFDFDRVVKAVAELRPTVVINAIGLVKQLPLAKDPVVAVTINSLWPHRLATLCGAAGAKLIHIGTDCVFSGRKGMYTEADTSDAEDLYGRSKLLGDVAAAGHLTLRTSIIGRELKTSQALVEWFLSQRGGCVDGFTGAVFSGFTTQALADLLGDIVERHPTLTGLYHASAAPINKHDLLVRLREAFKVSVTIDPVAEPRIDRSLDSSRLRRAIDYMPPSWDQMISRLAADPTPYDSGRPTRVS